jgi:hypothetical protein
MFFVEPDTDEWTRMWAELARRTGDAVEEHNGEVWQYMCSENGVHVFRHRDHPTRGQDGYIYEHIPIS